MNIIKEEMAQKPENTKRDNEIPEPIGNIKIEDN